MHIRKSKRVQTRIEERLGVTVEALAGETGDSRIAEYPLCTPVPTGDTASEVESYDAYSIALFKISCSRSLSMRTPLPRIYQGCLAGPTVNSLIVVSSGWLIAKATMLAIRSGEIPYLLYVFCIWSSVSFWLMVFSSSVLIAAG
jgi:hypothetical protein